MSENPKSTSEAAEELPSVESDAEASASVKDESRLKTAAGPWPIGYRRPSDVAVFTLLTLGVYAVWWRFRTARVLNEAGAKIPHPILTLVPIVHWWWVWRWAKGVERVLGQRDRARWAFWALVLLPLGESAAQAILNPRTDTDTKREPVPRGAMLALQVALPIVLCGAAVGVHWAVNVPDVVKESPRDQGAKKGKKKKAKKGRKKKKRKPRSAATLDRAWKRWSVRDFDDEPVSVDWAHRHQSLVRKAFLAARTAAFEGAPEQPVVHLEAADCHTIRCRLLLRSAFPHQSDAIVDALARMQSDSEALWRDYEAFRIPAPEGMDTEGADGKPNDYVQVTLAFGADDIKPKSMTVAEPAADSGGIVAVPPAPEPAPADPPKGKDAAVGKVKAKD